MKATKLKHRNIEFYLSDDCKGWFSLPEKEVYDFIDGIKPGSIFMDLGAAEGRFSVYAMKKGLLTYSVEPDKYNFDVLQTNMNLNKLDKKHNYKIAVTNYNGKCNLVKQQPWKGGHLKILENCSRNVNALEKEEVDCYRIDDFITQNQLEFPTHIKIDIDGSEENFLQGADKTLKKATKIIIELYESQTKIRFILKHKYNFIPNGQYQVLSINNQPYKGLFNYVFTK